MTIRYHDLEIEIDRCCCGEQEIRILESTYDRPRARFTLGDPQRAALEAMVAEFDELLLGDAEHASRRRELAEAIGIELYELLLSGPIGRTFERCLAALGSGEGLRLRLSFGSSQGHQFGSPAAGTAVEGSGEVEARSYDHRLGSLPWELLCHPKTHRFIGNQPETPVVRYLDLDGRIEPLDVEPPLKVLAVIASPDPATSKMYRYTKIEPEPHREILRAAIGAAKYLQLRFPKDDKATLAALHSELIEAERAGKPFHAVHFLGHGGFDEDGEGALFFERDDGSEHLVTGRELAAQLTEHVRLVVLASCDTGRIPLMRRNGQHPFAGVASALVAAGKRAVVAMQFTVSEAAAAAFATAFYSTIDADEPVDNAVTEGRLAIEARGDEGSLEWATPVLFLRSPDGRLLNLLKGRVPAKTVAIFNVLDLGKERIQHVDYEVDLRRYFDARYIRDPKDWNGAIMDDLRLTLSEKLPPDIPCHLELAAPLSVAFAAGFLLPVNQRRSVTVAQRDEIWHFEGDEPRGAASWLDDAAARARVPAEFPIAQGSRDIAVVVEGSRPAISAITAYLRREDLDPSPPRVGSLVYACFEDPDQYAIRGGAHARRLAQSLLNRIDAVAAGREYRTVHFFLAGPNGLALAIGRLCHVLPRIQLYEFDKEAKRHGTYEPSITLEPPEMGGTP
jgi:hypothetical protein